MDIKNKTLTELLRDTAAQNHSANAAGAGKGAIPTRFDTLVERTAFYTGFWAIFSRKVTDVNNTDNYKVAELQRICAIVDAGNMVVENYLDENYPLDQDSASSQQQIQGQAPKLHRTG